MSPWLGGPEATIYTLLLEIVVNCSVDLCKSKERYKNRRKTRGRQRQEEDKKRT